MKTVACMWTVVSLNILSCVTELLQMIDKMLKKQYVDFGIKESCDEEMGSMDIYRQ